MAIKVVTPAQMRALDAAMISEQLTPGALLMENAAIALALELVKRLPPKAKAQVVCGPGNNGGDGFAIARQLIMRGFSAKAILLGDAAKLTGDAFLNFAILKAAGHSPVCVTGAREFDNEFDPDADAIVDAVFGTGLSRPVSALALHAIERINASPAFKCAVDMPSGVDGNNGNILGDAVRADLTVTFQHPKVGHYLYPGRKYVGELIVEPIGMIFEHAPKAEIIDEQDARALLPRRAPSAHKGDNGKALLVAGSVGLAGAGVICAEAALRTGCGLLKAAGVRRAQTGFAKLPEAMAVPVDEKEWTQSGADAVLELAAWADVIAVGPGLGSGEVLCSLVKGLIGCGKPVVIDADALNALAGAGEKPFASHCVITPHPGEMARLSGLTVQELAQNPLECALRFAKEYNCTLLLKGATSVIANEKGEATLNITGNSALSKGGSGDVLTGIILGLLAQGLSPYDAARLGAYILGGAADALIRRQSGRSVIARDIINSLKTCPILA